MATKQPPEYTLKERKFKTRAMERTSFTLVTKDFQSLEYKRVIIDLYCQDVFNTFNCNQFTFDANSFEKNDIGMYNKAVKELKKANNFGFSKVVKESIGGARTGFGPGEVLSYIIVRNLTLAGSRESGDLRLGSNQFELKGGKFNQKQGGYHDFDFGGTVDLTDVKKDLAKLSNESGFKVTTRDIPSKVITSLKETKSKELEPILDKFRQLALDKYFKLHPVIIMNNNSKDNNFGEFITKVEIRSLADARKKLSIYRVKEDTVEPLVKV